MRLLLIEDDAAIARELKLRWERRGWEVLAVGTLRDGDRARETLPHVIVLDLGLPDGDGLVWLERLRRDDRATPVIALTARDQVSDRVAGLRTGADDYLVKPFAPEELDARIESLARRSNNGADDAVRFGTITWLRREGRTYLGPAEIELSPREFEVLGLLIVRAPRVVAKRTLIDALAEKNLEVGDSAAEVYVSRLRRKLAGSGTSIRTLRGFGYRLVHDAASEGAETAP